MTYTDLKGLAVSTTSADALAAYERGVDLFLRWRSGALEALDIAGQRDPSFALVHCTRAWIAWRMGRVDLAETAAKEWTTDDLFALVADKAGRTYWLNPEPRLYWNYGDSVIAAYERHCEAFECWTTNQLEDFVKALTRPVVGAGG